MESPSETRKKNIFPARFLLLDRPDEAPRMWGIESHYCVDEWSPQVPNTSPIGKRSVSTSASESVFVCKFYAIPTLHWAPYKHPKKQAF